MKVLLLTLDFPPNRQGGMANYYTGIARHYPHQELVLLTGASRTAVDTPECLVYRTPIRGGSLFTVPIWVLWCLYVIRRERIGLVLMGNPSPFKRVGAICRFITGTPFMLFFHGNDILRLSRRANRSPRAIAGASRLIARAAGIVTSSGFAGECVTAAFGKSCPPVIVCRPGVDEEFTRADPEPPRLEPGQPLRLVSVGRLTPRKGMDRVIESLAILGSRGHNVVCTHVGKGDSGHFVALARDLGVEDRIAFAGFVGSTADLIARVCEAHVFTMVSRLEAEGTDVEGFGIVFLEAAALKRPAVAGKSGGMGEAVVDGETGYLVHDPNSATAIAEVIERFLRDPASVTTMGQAGRVRVCDQFRWDGVCERLRTALGTAVLDRTTPHRPA